MRKMSKKGKFGLPWNYLYEILVPHGDNMSFGALPTIFYAFPNSYSRVQRPIPTVYGAKHNCDDREVRDVFLEP